MRRRRDLHDLVVKGRLALPDGPIERSALAIRAGRIVELGAHLAARETLDVGDALVLPGAIDCHVHFRDPGHPDKEDFGSGTRGAALGGVTTILDMPNTSPPVTTRAALEDKAARASAKSLVDFGLYAGLDEKGDALSLLPDVVALKVYMGATTGDLLVRDMALVRRALEAAARAGRTVAVHAEHQGCLDRHAHLARDDYASHAASRPAECEADAIRALREAAAGVDARVHVTHLSSASGLAALAGSGFTSDATPHHLLLDEARLSQGGAFKMNPALRKTSDRAAIFAAFHDGRIDALASDHAPHTLAQKAAPRMRECPAGVPGVQTLVPLLLAEAAAGRIDLARVVRASTAAARIFRLPGKGALAPGMDADLAVYEFAAARPVRGAELASKAGWSPFEGASAVFPNHVWLRGAPLVRDGRLVGAPGGGRPVALSGES